MTAMKKNTTRLLGCLASVLGLLLVPSPACAGDELATDRPVGHIEKVATFHGPMPTGVTVSHSGRIFVCFPKWGDPVEFTVAELKDGRPVPYPDEEMNRAESGPAADRLISV